MIRFVYVLAILMFSFVLEAYSQDSLQQKHMEVMSNINCDLSNSWAISLSLNDSTEQGIDANAIKSFLFTYKTKQNGRNSGVILNLYNIKLKDTVLEEKAVKYGSVHVEFLYTDNYVVYINHGKDVNEVYDSYMPVLLEELKGFFEINKNKL